MMWAYGLRFLSEEKCINYCFWRFPSLVNQQFQTLLQKCKFDVMFKFLLYRKFVFINKFRYYFEQCLFCEAEETVIQILLHL